MGYSSRTLPHRHRRGKPCQRCIRDLEIELGLRPLLPPPPPGPGGGSPAFRPDEDLLREVWAK